MNGTVNHRKLRESVERHAARMQKAEKERPTLLAQTVFVGVLALLFVLPVVGAAYLGSWLDSLLPGYSIRWTLSLLILGVAVGAMNVYLYIREH